MSNNRQDEKHDKQLSLNFELKQLDESIQRAVAIQVAESSGVRYRLELVVNNESDTTRLSPNSAEITRILASQAKTLGW